MWPLLLHRRCDRHRASADGVLLTGETLVQQQCVQSGEVSCFRYRHQEVPPVPAQLVFHATLLIAARRIAVLAAEAPVRPERDDSFGFFTLPSPQYLLHGNRQVVVTQRMEDSTEIIER